MGNERFGLVYDSAHWLSDVEVAAPESDNGGLVDAISHADGYAEPVAENYEAVGTSPSLHTEHGTRWATPVRGSAPRNALDLHLTGVTAVTVWVEEAGLDPGEELRLTVSTDTPVTVRLATGTHVRPVDLSPGDHGVDVTVYSG